MQFLTARTLLYARVVFLMAVAFFLVKDPESLSTLGFVILLGQAMRVPLTNIKPDNQLIGFCSITIFSMVVSDLIPLLANNIEYFETIVPTRLAVYFGLAAYSYFVNNSVVSNGMIFTFSFFEIWFNFLIYNNLKDEKYYKVKKYIEEHADEIREAENEKVKISEIHR